VYKPWVISKGKTLFMGIELLRIIAKYDIVFENPPFYTKLAFIGSILFVHIQYLKYSNR
jgi:hypothetical protein